MSLSSYKLKQINNLIEYLRYLMTTFNQLYSQQQTKYPVCECLTNQGPLLDRLTCTYIRTKLWPFSQSVN